MSKETGGPVFPTSPANYDESGWCSEGLQLRDYFAAKAMQGMLASGVPSGEIPIYAYEIADAMLAACGQ
ncbi:hypothetical protein B1H58_15315 [Pantoea alhagi]|uniref:Uncharacterized protein n=1 Tax=Pantoea alhagi TaxID=1891675 RepID=A0A1W6B839_9GAMM|nr:hypothetical protein [Pantoea alhagi]ARJ43266.1 hypothetical protein B1H58_15315 [Pantoea alhagi]